MKTPALMVLGTASYVGKSTLAAGLCRLLRQSGYRVAPFKAQNMSLNSAAAAGGEIGRAQAVQAAACGLAPTVDMNPVLLKPTGPGDCQLVLRGRPVGLRSSADYGRYGDDILGAIRGSYARLAASADVVVLEGAGSPAEINLLDRDFANMWMAEEADARCLLVGDIERGGVFAALYGTWALAPHQGRIGGFVINKLRGDVALLGDGRERLQALTGVPTLGVVPYREPDLPEEDAVSLPPRAEAAASGGRELRIGVLRLPHIANFTDFEPLRREPGVALAYVWDAGALEACDVIIIPGTKSTVDDLASLRARDLEPALRRAAAAGKPLLGICGGYQMLGFKIADPGGVESAAGTVDGLGLLPVDTVFAAEKRVGAVRGRVCGAPVAIEVAIEGYFIQHGAVTRHGGEALLELEAGPEGCVAERIWGVSPHGLFDAAPFRAFALERWRAWTGKTAPAACAVLPSPDVGLDARLDAWAAFLGEYLDLDAIFRLANLPPR